MEKRISPKHDIMKKLLWCKTFFHFYPFTYFRPYTFRPFIHFRPLVLWNFCLSTFWHSNFCLSNLMSFDLLSHKQFNKKEVQEKDPLTLLQVRANNRDFLLAFFTFFYIIFACDNRTAKVNIKLFFSFDGLVWYRAHPHLQTPPPGEKRVAHFSAR